MRLDHVSYAAAMPHLADTVQRLGARLGAPFIDGGLHPRFGTRNFILPMAGGTYIEVVAALDHPAADRAPFGHAVQACVAQGGGWMAWAVAVSDMSAAEARVGRPAHDGHRVRPDGFDLTWRQLGVLDSMIDGQLPFFMEWTVDREHHPSAGGKDISIAKMEMVGSPQAVSAWLGEPRDHPLEDVDVEWVSPESPNRSDAQDGLVAIVFSTPRGLVRID